MICPYTMTWNIGNKSNYYVPIYITLLIPFRYLKLLRWCFQIRRKHQWDGIDTFYDAWLLKNGYTREEFSIELYHRKHPDAEVYSQSPERQQLNENSKRHASQQNKKQDSQHQNSPHHPSQQNKKQDSQHQNSQHHASRTSIQSINRSIITVRKTDRIKPKVHLVVPKKMKTKM